MADFFNSYFFMSMSIRFPGTVHGLNCRALSPAHLLLFLCKILFYFSFLFLHPTHTFKPRVYCARCIFKQIICKELKLDKY